MPTPSSAITFQGRVYDPTTGAGVNSLRVRMLPLNNDGTLAPQVGEDTTDSNGAWGINVTGASESGLYVTEIYSAVSGQTRYIWPELVFQTTRIVGPIDAYGSQVAPLASGSIITSHIADADPAKGYGISTAKIQDSAVTTAKLAAGAVTAAKVAADVATQAELDAVSNAKVNRTGDTMTGVLTVPGVEISAGGGVDFRAVAGNADYDARLLVSGGSAGTPGQGALNVTAAVFTRNGQSVWDAGNDGAGSGLDADMVDGSHASAFAAAGHTHDAAYVNVTGDTMSGDLTISKGAPTTYLTETGAAANNQRLRVGAYFGDGSFSVQALTDAGAGGGSLLTLTRSGNSLSQLRFGDAGSPVLLADEAADTVTVKGNAVWHAGNDGAGSGLDADTLDGVQGSGYARFAHATFTGNGSYPRTVAGPGFVAKHAVVFAHISVGARMWHIPRVAGSGEGDTPLAWYLASDAFSNETFDKADTYLDAAGSMVVGSSSGPNANGVTYQVTYFG